jgi:hypothetical protein
LKVRYGAGALAGSQTPDGLLLLVVVELGRPAERGAARLGGPPPVVSAPNDAQPLILGHGAQEGDEAATEWRRQIEVLLV